MVNCRVTRYDRRVIKSFKDEETRRIFNGEFSLRFPIDIQKVALRKLRFLAAARTLTELKSPPSNQLEKLARERKGQYSIRINRQWRVCFGWNEGAEDVEITDYH